LRDGVVRNDEKEHTMNALRETLAAADLIPGDVVTAPTDTSIKVGSEIIGYPFRHPEIGETMVPIWWNGIEMTHLVWSETPIEVLR
jgi:hypothetical protein